MNNEGHMASSRSATLYYNGDVHTINVDHPNFERAVDALHHTRYDLAVYLMKPINQIKKLKYGFTVENNQVLDSEGDVVNNLVCTRIIEALGKDLPVDFLVNFLMKLRTNPSYQAQQELYKFLEVNDLPISPDGDFVAYKLVKLDWTDVYSGKIDNRVGSVVSMDRGLVDDDSNRTCSYGLHVCGFTYLKSYSGSRLVAVKINPRDVVSVPTDYNGTKMRCCRYQVDKELDIELVREEGTDELANTYGKCYRAEGPVDWSDAADDSEAYVNGYVEGYERGEDDNTYESSQSAIDDFDLGHQDGYDDATAGRPQKYC